LNSSIVVLVSQVLANMLTYGKNAKGAAVTCFEAKHQAEKVYDVIYAVRDAIKAGKGFV